MKRIILDHFRRWWWVLLFDAMFGFGLGWFIANDPEANFEFWGLLVALWTGANLLSIDLRRGVIRAVATLPLTTRQIGRSWWMATVAIPAIALAALLFLGAGTCHRFHPNQVFPADRLAMAGLFTLLWLGSIFTCIFPTPGFYGLGWERARVFLTSVLSATMILGGMLYFQDASKVPFKLAIFFVVGGLLTVVGWFRADHLVKQRAGFRLAPQTSRSSTSRSGGSKGYGGLRLLFQTIFIWQVIIGLLTTGGFYLIDRDLSLHHNNASHNPAVPFIRWWLVMVQLFAVSTHLRFLRTLPFSAGKLSAVLALAPLTAMLTVVFASEIILSAFAGFSPISPVEMFRRGYFLQISLMMVVVPLIVWRGHDIAVTAWQGKDVVIFLLLVAGMVLVIFGHGFMKNHLPVSAAVSLLVVFGSFWTTRLILERSGKTYRRSTIQLGGWGLGRGW